MRRLLVLGAGTAGTMAVNRLRPRLSADEWQITVVDPAQTHYYQPGFLFIPFGKYRPDQVTRPRRDSITEGVALVTAEVDRVLPEQNQVLLTDGRTLDYDYLVIASGTTPRPDQTPGMTGEQWRRSIHEFYTYEGAVALAEKLRHWPGGHLVVQVIEMPIKCPVAPLEFAFLADAFFTDRGIRDRVRISYVTPLEGAFTKPAASARLGGMLAERSIALEPDFVTERIDPGRRTLVSYDEREIGFDLLVTVPVNMGADFVGRSGLGDELNYLHVDRHTLQSSRFDNIFGLGDACDIPASKAGSVAHFSMDVFVQNFLRHVAGLPMTAAFDGHANCFIESGHGKGLLIDFSYDTEPLPGSYPLPTLGPFRLLRESPVNHWGKLAFRWIYWHLLLPGRTLPIPHPHHPSKE
jgi:sulfide:quinone oxidoreductase